MLKCYTPARAALVFVLLPVLLAAPLPLGAADRGPDAGSPCAPDAAGHRQDLVRWINEVRAGAGLEPLAAQPDLCAVAQRRAEQMAAAGSVESDQRAIQGVSRALLGEGYRAHRWTERAILGYEAPVRMARSWGASAAASFRDTVLGPFEEVGVGVAPGSDGTAISLLFAVPRLSELTRVSEPLADLDEVRAKALARVNEARRRAGRPAVVPNPRLDAAAQRYAELMLERGFYAHVTDEGGSPRSRVAAAGYGQLTFLGENIAQGLFEPDEVVERWLGSRDHRKNILHREAAETGLGVAFGDTPDGFRVLWVQLFGRRR